jgi:hypothetical protein
VRKKGEKKNQEDRGGKRHAKRPGAGPRDLSRETKLDEEGGPLKREDQDVKVVRREAGEKRR